MVTYMQSPRLLTTITHLGVNYTPDVVRVDVKRVENGFDSATVDVADTQFVNYTSRAAAGDAITLQVKDASDAAYTTIFSGIIRVCLPSLDAQRGQLLLLKCDGAGYGLAETLCGEEYGVESRNPTLDTIKEIVTDSSGAAGVEELYVNAFSATSETWYEGGATPFLNDSDTNYVRVPFNGYLESYWTFPVSAGSGTINSVKLRFEGSYTGVSGGKITVEVWNGAAWVNVGDLTLNPNGIYAWVEVDVSATLNTWTKINGCQVRVTSITDGSHSDWLRRLTRKVDYAGTGGPHGILPAWVNSVLGDTAKPSGYTYTSSVNAITGDIKYICFPYKPANRCIDDLCDLATAIRQGVAYHPDHCGPQWIVDTNNVLRMKLINGTQTAWTKYYGDSVAAATLVQGVDFTSTEFQNLDPEGNCVLYYGNWRRPSNGDSWTESSIVDWGCEATNTLSLDATNHKVGNNSVKSNNNDNIFQECSAWTPLNREGGFDFSWCTEFSTPTINFWARRSGACALFYLFLHTCTGGVPDGSYWTDLTASMAAANTWYHFSFPVGPYYNVQESPSFAWTVDGTPNWAAIDDVYFHAHCGQNVYMNIDGLHFGGAPILRVAKNSTSIAACKLRTRIIVDDVGKDDSLKATDDSGLMAQLAYAELLRLQTSPKVGTLITPMIKDLLPGQWLHLHALAKPNGTFAVDGDMRTPEFHQVITPQGFLSSISVTNDLTNTHTRKKYDDMNQIFAAIRPEFQDRQAASMKAGTVDIRVLKLEKDYP